MLMIATIFLSAVVLCFSEEENVQKPSFDDDSVQLNRSRRIVNGDPLPAWNDKWPMLAFMRGRIWWWRSYSILRETFYCGAMILTDRRLLSACSCFEFRDWNGGKHWMHSNGFDKMRVTIGRGYIRDPKTDYREYWPNKNNKLNKHGRICHPNYTISGTWDTRHNEHDIAIYITQEKMPIGKLSPVGRHDRIVDLVRLPYNIPLGPNKDKPIWPENGAECFAMGWGCTDPNKIGQVSRDGRGFVQQGSDLLMRYSRCRGDYLYANFKDQFCAGINSKNRTCDFDRGGPLMCPYRTGSTVRYYPAGIISHIQHRDRAFKSTMFTRITYYLDWIVDKVDIPDDNIQFHLDWIRHNYREPYPRDELRPDNEVIPRDFDE